MTKVVTCGSCGMERIQFAVVEVDEKCPSCGEVTNGATGDVYEEQEEF